MNIVNRGSRRMRRLSSLIVAALLLASPAIAELLPRPDRIALPQEKPILTDTLLKLLKAPDTTRAEALATLDGALARLPQPTKLRGFVQFVRAGALIGRDAPAPAREAIEESIRLLPDYSGPLLGAVHIYAYSDQPGPAADYLLRASRIDPQMVAKIPEYEIQNIVRRLEFAADYRRIRTLGERLVAIGWRAESLSGQSALVRRAIEARLLESDLAGARALLPKLLSPTDSRILLMQNRFRPLWPDIEQWAGSKLEKQWQVYLAESRERWDASKDPANALPYLQALDKAGHDETIIRTFLPLFSQPLNHSRDQDLIFVASPLANALARRGRWDDAEAMYDHAMKVWPLGKGANALNLSANRARQLFYRGKTDEGLLAIDATLAEAARWKDEINGDAIAAMHHHRACMLHALGRDAEGLLSRTAVMAQRGLVGQAELFLCLDEPNSARDTLIAGLADEDAREDILSFLQNSDAAPMQSEYGRISQARARALRSDPQVLVAVVEHGRVLPFTLSEGAPVEAK